MKIVVKLPVFSAKVTILLGDYKDIEQYVPLDLRGDINDDIHEYQGICCSDYKPHQNTLTQCYIHCREVSFANIAHECLHATNYILGAIGAEACFHNDEVQAYVLSHLLHAVEKRLG